MKNPVFLCVILFLFGCSNNQGNTIRNEIEISFNELEKGFLNPPHSAGVRCYWWWLNGNVTEEAITRDLEEMKDKGFNGALIFDADGSSQYGSHLFGSTLVMLRELVKTSWRRWWSILGETV